MVSEQQNAFLSALGESLKSGSFVKLSLSGVRGTDPTLRGIEGRIILVKREPKLSLTFHHKTRDIVKNHSFVEGVDIVGTALAEGAEKASLFSTEFDLVWQGNKLKRKAPSETQTPSLQHDRQKNRLIAPAGKAYLTALGITDKDGHVRKDAQDKFRQINQYVELLSPHLKSIAPERLHKIVDMGSGKGYLTFALYDYLSNVLGLEVVVTGVEFRQDLVELCNTIAEQSGFSGLRFVQGSIADYDSTGTNVLIALHACDTATDDAIAKGISAGAELIAVAPCCHKQIRREIEKAKSANDLDFLFKHGIFVERQAEMVTDGIRALVMEHFGYSTKVFEFISDAHTPKNVLIVGSKARAIATDRHVLDKIAASKSYFGIAYHHLERATGLSA